MSQKTFVDVLAEESTRFIKLPFFLTALQFSPLNKGCDITREVFFRLLDEGLKLHYSEPGHLNDGVKISNGDVKCALLRVDKALFDTDIPRDKLFSQQIIKTESRNEIELGDILIGRYNVKQLYFKMSLDTYPWVKIPWPSSEVDCMDFPVDCSNHMEKKLRLKQKLPQPWLEANPKDPKPKYAWYIPARYFARQLVEGDSTLLTKRNLLAKKIVTSLTNAGIKKRGDRDPFDPNTIKKSLSNIDFG